METHAARRFAILVPFLSLALLPAQADWRPLDGTQPAGRFAHAVAWDSVRQRLVLFGGNAGPQLDDTWEWNGQQWFRLEPDPAPPRRYYAGMAYDPVRRKTVLFGGIYSQMSYADTWEWDGSSWTRVLTTTTPSARLAHTMTWDPVRQRIVMFGGQTTLAGASTDQTWEYDGVDWVRRTPSASPPARAYHGAAFDASRGMLVVYGGRDGSNVLTDTWEWDGTSWQQRTASAPSSAIAPLAYDAVRQRVVLYGGSGGGLGTPSQETWEWDGGSWSLVPTTANVGPRSGHVMAFDSARGRVLVIGGTTFDFFQRTSSVAAFDGTTWSVVRGAAVMSVEDGVVWDGSSRRPLAFGGRFVIVGDSDATHTFDGTRWVREQPANSPSGRRGHRMAFDRVRSRVVLFGGGFLQETWEWDGSTWSQIATAHAPAGRSDAAMVYDERRERIVLFGGQPALFNVPFADTWEYDGRDWTAVTTATSPGSRTLHAMAFDGDRGVTVMFGGSRQTVAVQVVDETWEYDGVDWRHAAPVTRPTARIGHDMEFDPVRGRVVMFGGDTAAGPSTETWEWDGVDWAQMTTTMRPRFGRLVFDEDAAKTLLFADGAEGWEYATAAPPELTPYGAGCAGALGVPELANAVLEYPVLGRALDLHVDGSRPAWPVVLMVGLSRTQWIGGALPLDLTPAGAPGCWLLQSDDAYAVDTADLSGRAVFTLQVPNATTLLGGQVWCQAFVVDATSNPLGWVASPGLGLTVGW